eukprot:CAMPEP_0113680536 /NCGR_PEP_ID=MMETSP0038_2-20120614/11386_1 /TAXON_ID=2898 /ORGANISM="Cryptomonas paramecium" /LENGTH=104 /DNA_ID=CAMNT_0000598953 /DNA_START=306 /DNA_END=620 /DNA_ORIENTATION=+ /assembly_acc=CAM_ASM_000170
MTAIAHTFFIYFNPLGSFVNVSSFLSSIPLSPLSRPLYYCIEQTPTAAPSSSPRVDNPSWTQAKDMGWTSEFSSRAARARRCSLAHRQPHRELDAVDAALAAPA